MSEQQTTDAAMPQGSPPPGPTAPVTPSALPPTDPPAPAQEEPPVIVGSLPPMTHTLTEGIAGYAVAPIEPPAPVEPETVSVMLHSAPTSPLMLAVNGRAVSLQVGAETEIPRAFLPALRDASGVVFSI